MYCRKPHKKKRKKTDKQKLKELAWKLFSQYIRRRYADRNGYVECVTCGVYKNWKQLQAGHFIDGRNNTVLFNELFVFPQCYRCNVLLKGNKVQYTLFMLSQGYSQEEIKKFDSLKMESKNMYIQDYQEIIEHYSDALVGLDIRDEG